MGNHEMNCNTKIYALDSGFFFASKRKSVFKQFYTFSRVGERLSPGYGKRKKGKRFFLVHLIQYIFTTEGLVCNQRPLSVRQFRFPIFAIFEAFIITALLLGREAYWSCFDDVELRHRADQKQVFKDIGVPKMRWRSSRFWKGYLDINIVWSVLLWTLDAYKLFTIPHCAQQCFCIAFITSRTHEGYGYSSSWDKLVSNVGILYLLSKFKHNLV